MFEIIIYGEAKMRKILALSGLAGIIFATNAYAEVGAELFDEETMPADAGIDAEEKTSSSSETKNSENSEENDSSIFSFITKPMSLLFAADDKVADENGKEETFLEKSIRLANEGNLESQLNLGYMYLYGANGVKQDFAEALKYYTLAAEQNDPVAVNNLGSLYFSGIGTAKNYNKAIALFTTAANLGNDNAATNLGFIYLTGGSKDPLRNQKAVEYFKKGATKGNNIAKFMLGYAYYKGFVVPQDMNKAFKLVRAAAAKDSSLDEAQIVLGEMYIKGDGVVQNYNRGTASFYEAVKQGNSEAYTMLADLLTQEKYLSKDLITAHTLYNLASVQGEPKAAEKRDAIGKSLQIAQLKQAQENASNFKAAPSELTSYVRQTFGSNIRSYIDMNIGK